ncbi:MAG TPA: HAEPLYID family protein [Ferruginibacter sp.]|nr:HAEPLYID family protein [Ferruginibacter sp.]HRO17380.1 HAEPLYID family protein [Ferruginibacter sp.]HRQ21085.1 HAEPLYID family protein [Ferruginibacter sp.]
MKVFIFLSIWNGMMMHAFGQQTPHDRNEYNDSLYINEVEKSKKPAKVLHAEPLYIDLIRDLGARKGEKEWNVGLGLTDNNEYDKYTALVEYEWAPIDRLGLEIELPFSIYYPTSNHATALASKLNSLKLAGQYTFVVSEKNKTSLAFGYIHEFELTTFNRYKNYTWIEGNVYNPFFVAAKRWGNHFHTLLYTGPAIMHHFKNNATHTSWQINSNFHYMITGTRNFIGVELNKTVDGNDFDMTIRPQMRVGITDHLLVGIVTGIPISRENERFSTFIRLIYEPPHKKK